MGVAREQRSPSVHPRSSSACSRTAVRAREASGGEIHIRPASHRRQPPPVLYGTRMVEPDGQGRESVWEDPRPPRVEPSTKHVQVVLGGRLLAHTTAALRVLETSHPPVYYVPVADIDMACLRQTRKTSWCEFKGTAVYWDADTAPTVGWSYPEPSPGFEDLRGHVAFYPGRVDEATVDSERVEPQEGGFYGGWITSTIVGPFKGGAGTHGW